MLAKGAFLSAFLESDGPAALEAGSGRAKTRKSLTGSRDSFLKIK